MIKFFRFAWSHFDEDLELDSGNGVYYVTAGIPYNVDDMKNIVSQSLKVSADNISIKKVTEITKEEYERVTAKKFQLP